MAQAMRCVNDAFDWPISARWLLMTRRFSSSALTGMLRTDVAVGTDSDASMFWAIFADAPRRGTVFVVAVSAGAGTGTGRAGAAGVFTGAGAAVEESAGEDTGAPDTADPPATRACGSSSASTSSSTTGT